MRFIAPFLVSTCLASAAFAQDRANTILVLDGSGSMWGQIDGIAKITIAQEVVGDLMQSIPADQNIGLTVYGHRERGNCADIETIVEPGPDTREAIVSAVNGIRPLGRTPMTDSIIAAATALRYTEERATVILVSDGVETCNPDPCAAMRLLEEAAIEFTAHVVGFDVGADALALQQLQCIAQETGGRFMTADNADELSAALEEVAAAPEPEPVFQDVTFTAVVGESRRALTSPVLWTIGQGDSVEINEAQGNPLVESFEVGAYRAGAYSLELEQEAAADFIVTESGAVAVEVVFDEPLPTATLIAPESAVAGAEITVEWVGPNSERDYISIGRADERYANYTYTSEGSPLQLLMPAQPGAYELRYQVGGSNEIIATRAITVTEAQASLTASETAVAGQELTVSWTGPDYDLDYISIARVGERYINYTYTREGNPLQLLMPAQPGTYELRYQLHQDNEIIATRAITVTEAQASLTASETAVAGQELTVSWTGPDYDLDYISIARVGERYINYTYTREGNPLQLTMPTEPGVYELRYQLHQDNEIIATRPITVTEAQASLTAPETAVAGQELTVSWTGPDYDLDYISIARVGERYINYTYTREGNPLQLTMPTEPGVYELRYQLHQDNEIIATSPITVQPLTVTLAAPSNAKPGTEISVTWQGAGYTGDYLTISRAGESGYESYRYVSEGSPLTLTVPEAAGDYEIRYYVDQDRDTPVASVPLRVQ